MPEKPEDESMTEAHVENREAHMEKTVLRAGADCDDPTCGTTESDVAMPKAQTRMSDCKDPTCSGPEDESMTEEASEEDDSAPEADSAEADGNTLPHRSADEEMNPEEELDVIQDAYDEAEDVSEASMYDETDHPPTQEDAFEESEMAYQDDMRYDDQESYPQRSMADRVLDVQDDILNEADDRAIEFLPASAIKF